LEGEDEDEDDDDDDDVAPAPHLPPISSMACTRRGHHCHRPHRHRHCGRQVAHLQGGQNPSPPTMPPSILDVARWGAPRPVAGHTLTSARIASTTSPLPLPCAHHT
jgi:hypothetical protein